MGKFAIIGRKFIYKEIEVGISVFPTGELDCGALWRLESQASSQSSSDYSRPRPEEDNSYSERASSNESNAPQLVDKHPRKEQHQQSTKRAKYFCSKNQKFKVKTS